MFAERRDALSIALFVCSLPGSFNSSRSREVKTLELITSLPLLLCSSSSSPPNPHSHLNYETSSLTTKPSYILLALPSLLTLALVLVLVLVSIPVAPSFTSLRATLLLLSLLPSTYHLSDSRRSTISTRTKEVVLEQRVPKESTSPTHVGLDVVGGSSVGETSVDSHQRHEGWAREGESEDARREDYEVNLRTKPQLSRTLSSGMKSPRRRRRAIPSSPPRSTPSIWV